MRTIEKKLTLNVTRLCLVSLTALLAACSSESSTNAPVATGGATFVGTYGVGGNTAVTPTGVATGGAIGQASSAPTVGGATATSTMGVAGNGGTTGVATTAATVGGTNATGGTTAIDPCAPKTCSQTTCTPVKPTQALITDFTSGKSDFNSGSEEWWTEFFGGTYAYPVTDACKTEQPANPLSQTYTDGKWTIAGTVAGYAGFGMYFAPCSVDMSDYTGVSFVISGTAGTELTFTVGTVENTKAAADTCPPTVATCTATDCAPNKKTITLTDAPTTVTVLWTDLTGGAPSTSVKPAQITNMAFAMPWDWAWTVDGGGVPADHAYSVNVVIDEIRLVQ